MLQEALHNVVKHARANCVGVSSARHHGRTALLIEDDGQGFDPSARPADSETLGLISMRERAALAGCECMILKTERWPSGRWRTLGKQFGRRSPSDTETPFRAIDSTTSRLRMLLDVNPQTSVIVSGPRATVHSFYTVLSCTFSRTPRAVGTVGTTFYGIRGSEPGAWWPIFRMSALTPGTAIRVTFDRTARGTSGSATCRQVPIDLRSIR